jgi:hypothetical protein
MFAKLTGDHAIPFSTEARTQFRKKFNADVDKILEAMQNINSRIAASKYSKDKTRLLTFAAPMELLESVIEDLLKPATAVELAALSPEELVKKLADVDVDTYLSNFKAENIKSEINLRGYQAAETLATWFATQVRP